MQDLGIVKPGSTLRILFGSYDGGTGASIVASAFVVADIKVFKDGNTTERASTSGFTATVTFSAETGIHLVGIDLADNTTAGFFVAGSEYIVAIGPITIDAQTVNFPIARFIIGYPGAILDTGITSLTSATQFILDNGPSEADVLIGCPVILHDVASRVQFALGVVSDYIVTTKEVFLAATPVGFTPVATDNVSFFMPANVHSLRGNLDASIQLRDNLDTTERFIVHDAFTPTTTQTQPDAVFFGATAGTLEATDNHYNDRTIIGLTGVNKGQAKLITDYDGTNKRFTHDAFTAPFAANDEFIVI